MTLYVVHSQPEVKFNMVVFGIFDTCHYRDFFLRSTATGGYRAGIIRTAAELIPFKIASNSKVSLALTMMIYQFSILL